MKHETDTPMISCGTRAGKTAALALISLFWGCTALVTGAAPREAIYGPDPNRRIDESAVAFYVSPDGDDARDGKTRQTALRTMQKAVDLVAPGQTVLVLKGRYRDGFWINKQGRPDAWISIVAEPGTEIRGSDVVTTWKKESEFTHPVYSIPRPRLYQDRQKPDTPLAGRTEQVFVNGTLLNQVIDKGMLKPRDLFYVDDAADTLFVCLKDGRDPNREKTEVSYRTWAIAVGGKPNQNCWGDLKSHEANRASYVRIDGFTIRNIACFARQSAIEVRGTCHHIIIENCDVQWASSYGINVGGAVMFSSTLSRWLDAVVSDVIVRNNIMSNCGVGGGGGGCASHLTVEYNLIDNNNYKGVSPWAEGGAFKTGFGGSNIVIRCNIARNNNNHGLWFDYGATGCIFENNFVYKSVAGGILNEVTPAPDRTREANGQQSFKQYSLEELKQYNQPGTIIRNNVVVGTIGFGGGINSASPNGAIYNNVIAYCAGAAFNTAGGGTQRRGVVGSFNNRIYSNIAYDNRVCAAISTDNEAVSIFNNVYRDNLFLNWKDAQPAKIDNAWADAAAFAKCNRGATNYFFKDRTVFRNPEHFDFTLTDPEIAARIGFAPGTMRLDWSEFYVETRKVSATPDSNLQFQPIDISPVLNRALEDEVADDGKGGWTDQGLNDMSRLPVGPQVFSGIPFTVGSKERGALFMKNNTMKEGATFPEEASIALHSPFQKLYFLYGAAWCGDQKLVNGTMVRNENSEHARFIVDYQDGTRAEIPLTYGRHILDWWEDPANNWQTCATLNDHGAYVAWQGPNRDQGGVTLYYLRWNNPEPEKQIRSVTISKKTAGPESVFFFLGLTGANDGSKGKKSDRVFAMDFNGNVDATDAYGRDIEVRDVDTLAFKAAKFAPGARGKGIIPVEPLYYTMPEEFPFDSGTLSLWLNADDYLTDKRTSEIKDAEYRKTMWPLTATFRAMNEKEPAPRGITCFLRFNIDPAAKSLTLESLFGSVVVNGVVSSIVKPGEWFHVAVKWERSEDGNMSTQKVFINGTLLAEKNGRYYGAKTIKRDQVIVGVSSNRGQPWIGTMDDLTVWDRPLSDLEIAECAKAK